MLEDESIIDFISTHIVALIIIILVYNLFKYIKDYNKIPHTSDAVKVIDDILSFYGLKDNIYFKNQLLYRYKYKKCNTHRKLERYLLKILNDKDCYNKIPKRLKGE